MLPYTLAKHHLTLHGRKGRWRTAWRHTYLVDRIGYIAVDYQDREIIRLYPDGTYQLFAGLGPTKAVRDRITELTPARLLKKPRMFALILGRPLGQTAPLVDGVRVDGRGYVIPDPVPVPQRLVRAARSE